MSAIDRHDVPVLLYLEETRDECGKDAVPTWQRAALAACGIIIRATAYFHRYQPQGIQTTKNSFHLKMSVWGTGAEYKHQGLREEGQFSLNLLGCEAWASSPPCKVRLMAAFRQPPCPSQFSKNLLEIFTAPFPRPAPAQWPVGDTAGAGGPADVSPSEAVLYQATAASSYGE